MGELPVSLPKLLDFDWSVSQQSGSNALGKMNSPIIRVKFILQEHQQQEEGENVVEMELGMDSLTTMIRTLSQIKSQLSSLK